MMECTVNAGQAERSLSAFRIGRECCLGCLGLPSTLDTTNERNSEGKWGVKSKPESFSFHRRKREGVEDGKGRGKKRDRKK